MILGDPDDRTLRQVEREIMIPQKMKEIAKKENCNKHVVGWLKLLFFKMLLFLKCYFFLKCLCL